MSNLHTSKKPVIKDWHPADIKAAIEKAGWSLRRLSEHHGYAPSTLIHALRKPYPNAENIIAQAVGKNPWEIWPSRYCNQQKPLRKRASFPTTRPTNWVRPGIAAKHKHSKLGEPCNIYVMADE